MEYDILLSALMKPLDLVRFCFIVFVSYLLTYLLPPLPAIGSATIIPQLLLYSFLLGFLVNRSLLRKQSLLTSHAVELSRLRRIHHLVESIRNKKWNQEVHRWLLEYQKGLARSVHPRREMDELFRKLSHLIYGYKPASRHEELLYQDMLESIREIALERQRFQSALSGKLTWYSWLVIMTNAVFVVALLLANRSVSNFSFLGVGAAITGVLITLDLLIQTGRISPQEFLQLQKGYTQNIKQEQDCDGHR